MELKETDGCFDFSLLTPECLNRVLGVLLQALRLASTSHSKGIIAIAIILSLF